MKSNRMLHAMSLVAAILLPASAQAGTTLAGNMTADNAFFAYVGTSANSLGTQVASGNNWPSSFSFTPTTLTSGVTNYVNVEAINQGGPGGLSFDLSLAGSGFQFGNGLATITSEDVTDFTASYNNTNSSFTVQPWVAATGAAQVDTGYGWGNIVGTSTWADAAVNGLNICQYCTVDFTIPIYATTTGAVPEPASWMLMLTGFVFAGLALRRRVRVRHSVA